MTGLAHLDTGERPAAIAALVTGIAATVLFIAGGLLIAPLPGAGASGEEVARYAVDHRTLLLATSYVWGVAICAQLAFAVALRDALSGGRPGTLLGVGLSAAIALVALEFAGFALVAALAFRPPTDPAGARLLGDLVLVTLSYAGFAAALWSGAYSLAMLRDSGIHAWVAWLGFASAAAHLEAAGAFARSGAFSPSGWGGYAGPNRRRRP
ncbi:MAG: hypothetical protein HYX53_02385 [Chloroflexi bacterium]|nr:hypothetical protein [Chloroflexota bacterium]